jgi:hypothetical protein
VDRSVKTRESGVASRIKNIGQPWWPGFYRRNMHWAYFDARWYLRTYPDVEQAWRRRRNKLPIENTALGHYLQFGWKEGRNPSPYFDTFWYLQQNSAVKTTGIEPLRHYIREGWRLGRSPSTYFDTEWYLKQNPDVAAADTEPLQHYVESGYREGRNPNCLFDVKWYMEQNPVVLAAGIEPLYHYLTEGWRSGRAPSVHFDSVWYLQENPDVAAAGREPLDHYLSQVATRKPNQRDKAVAGARRRVRYQQQPAR